MQSTTRYALSVILLSSVVSSTYHPVQTKRQLYAFPRVGRGHPDYQLLQLEEFLLGRRNPFQKRQNFEQMEGKDTTGMWFGPRLGRSFRSDDDAISQSDNEKSEPEELENTNREKRQTKRS